MRKLIKICLVVTTMVATSSAFAAGASNIDKFGLSVTTTSNTMISGKYFIDNDTAVLGGGGLLKNTNATDIYLMGGLRKYSSSSSAGFVPFFGVRGWYSSIKSANSSIFGFSGEAGAEYFLDKHFSIEGLASVGYNSTTPTGGTSTSVIGTSMYALGANFYF